MALLACGPAHRPRLAPLDARPARIGWVDAPPPGCRVGSTGPTLDPGNALRAARAAAIEAMARGDLLAEIRSISGTGSHGDFELSTQSLSGVARDVRLVAFWGETRLAQGPTRRIDRVHALACGPEIPIAPSPGATPVEAWLASGSASQRICALGLSGPTWRREDQPARVLEDAQRSLALAIETRVEKRVLDRGRGVVRVAREVTPSASAQARARAATALEQEWRDEAGSGPLGLPGVLYGLACLDG